MNTKYTPNEEEQGRIARKILMEKGKSSCEEMPKHTPTQGQDELVEHLKRVLDSDHNWANDEKEFIVRAINSHEELLRAAKEAMQALKHWGDKAENYEKANDPVRLYAHGLLHEAIAKAEAK